MKDFYLRTRSFYAQRSGRRSIPVAEDTNYILRILKTYQVDCGVPLLDTGRFSIGPGTFTIIKIDEVVSEGIQTLLVKDVLDLAAETEDWRSDHVNAPDGSEVTIDDILDTLLFFWDDDTGSCTRSSLFTLYLRKELGDPGLGRRRGTQAMKPREFWNAVARSRNALAGLLQSPTCRDIYDAQQLLSATNRDPSEMLEEEINLLQGCPGLGQIQLIEDLSGTLQDVFRYSWYASQIPVLVSALQQLQVPWADDQTGRDAALQRLLGLYKTHVCEGIGDSELAVAEVQAQFAARLDTVDFTSTVKPFLEQMDAMGYTGTVLSRLEIFERLVDSPGLWDFVVKDELTRDDSLAEAVRELLMNTDYEYFIFEEFDLAARCIQVLRTDSFSALMQVAESDNDLRQASAQKFLCVDNAGRHLDKIRRWFLMADDESFSTLQSFREYLVGGVYEFQMLESTTGSTSEAAMTLQYEPPSVVERREDVDRATLYSQLRKEEYTVSSNDLQKTITRLGFQQFSEGPSGQSVRFFLDQYNAMLRLKEMYQELSECGHQLYYGRTVPHQVLSDDALRLRDPEVDLDKCGDVFKEQRRRDASKLHETSVLLQNWRVRIEEDLRQYPHLQIFRPKEILWLHSIMRQINQSQIGLDGQLQASEAGGSVRAMDSLGNSLFLCLKRIPALQGITIEHSKEAILEACGNLDNLVPEDNASAPPTLYLGRAIDQLVQQLGARFSYAERPRIPALPDAQTTPSLCKIHSVKALSRCGLTRLIIQLFAPDFPEHHQVLFCSASVDESHVMSLLRCVRSDGIAKAFVIIGVERLSLRSQELLSRYQQDVQLFAQPRGQVGTQSRATLHCLQSRPTLLQEGARDGILRWKSAQLASERSLYRTLGQRVLCKGAIVGLRLFVGPPGSGKTYRARLLQKCLAKKTSARCVEFAINEAFCADDICERLHSLISDNLQQGLVVFFNFSFGHKEEAEMQEAADADTCKGWDDVMNSVNEFFFELLVLQSLRSTRSGICFAIPLGALHVLVEVPFKCAVTSHGNAVADEEAEVQELVSHAPVLRSLLEADELTTYVRNEDPFLLHGDGLRMDGTIDFAGEEPGPDDELPEEQNVFKYLEAYFKRSEEDLVPGRVYHINSIHDELTGEPVRMSRRSSPSLQQRQILLASAMLAEDGIDERRASSILRSQRKNRQRLLVQHLLRRVQVMEDLPGYQYNQSVIDRSREQQVNGLGSTIFGFMLQESREYLDIDLSSRDGDKVSGRLELHSRTKS
eukprot:scaffold7079_cov154-Pinguiococcus_pyrenoidosus.AAC.5